MTNKDHELSFQYKTINKYIFHFYSGAFGIIFLLIVIGIISLIENILIIFYEVDNIPNKNGLLIAPILLLIALFTFGIFLVFFIKYMNQKSQHQLYSRTILISFVVFLIIYIVVFWIM